MTAGEWSAEVPIRRFPNFTQRWIPALYRYFRESLKSWAGTEMVVLIKLKRRCSIYNERMLFTINPSHDVSVPVLQMSFAVFAVEEEFEEEQTSSPGQF